MKIGILILVNIALSVLMFFRPYPELSQIARYDDSFAHLKEFFQDAAQRKGGAYAFELLRRADLPDGTDIHLLGHVVGDVLYRQKGKDGMTVCTQEFRNACSHTVVVGLYLERGEEALRDIAAVCKGAPGGAGAYTMCFHGLGHGVLAVAQYDFRRAVELCGSVVPEGFVSRESVECIGGAVMELVSGGDHDKIAWERQKAVFLSSDDPFLPCDAAYIPRSARAVCYEYLTPHFFDLIGSSLTDPSEEEIREAFQTCTLISQNDANRAACFRGFGKELVNLVLKNDIRTQTITTTQAQDMYRLCSLAPDQQGRQQCMMHLVNSLYWGGENPEGPARALCAAVPDGADREVCNAHLAGAVSYYSR